MVDLVALGVYAVVFTGARCAVVWVQCLSQARLDERRERARRETLLVMYAARSRDDDRQTTPVGNLGHANGSHHLAEHFSAHQES